MQYLFNYFLLKQLLLLFIFTSILQNIFAQDPTVRGRGGNGNTGKGTIGNVGDRFNNISKSGGNSSQGGLDSLKKRNFLADSITISYRYFNDAKRYNLDSTIDDYKRGIWKPDYIVLGNNGAPAKPILFTPNLKAGFDEGKHSLDLYQWTTDQVKFYKTTRPYTELAYVLGSKAEQDIQFTHTQNPKPNFNFAFDYRLLSSPGYFRNQKNNHGNTVLNSHFISKKKRYNNWFIALNNNYKQADNGGVKNLADLSNPIFKDKLLITTQLTNQNSISRNPFDSKLESGQAIKDRTYLMRQSYDFGKKDSIAINDSTTQYLFYSKLRLEHTISAQKQYFAYRGFVNDSTFYKAYSITDTIFRNKYNSDFEYSDSWNTLVNDFSVYSYPDTKNTQQYIKAGVTFQNMKGTFKEGYYIINNRNINNLFVHFDYKNRTKNKKWDLEAIGQLYVSGYNSGDYEANATLIRLTNHKLGNIKLQAQNVNRTPSFIFYNQSTFNFGTITNIKKENSLQINAQVFNEKKQQNITLQLLACNNQTTWQSFNTFRQESLFNMLQFIFARTFKVYKKVVWHSDIMAQQIVLGNANINYAKLYTRNRIAYEGNFGQKNLKIATGIEMRYIAPYKLDAYSPINSQFVYSDTVSSKKNLPDIAAYMHFSISSFNAFIRAENLNTASYTNSGANNGFSFSHPNIAGVRYVNPGLVIRLGIYWRFIN